MFRVKRNPVPPVLKEFQMTEVEFTRLNTLSMVGHLIEGQISALWKSVGDRMGFDYRTARPIPGKPPMFLQAEPLKEGPVSETTPPASGTVN